jgi:hypothetical protein
VVATGLPASPGAAVGQVVFTAEDAEEWHAQGKSAILVFFFILKAIIFLISFFPLHYIQCLKVLNEYQSICVWSLGPS